MRTVKHFSLHRIAGPVLSAAEGPVYGGTELRVVADVEAGVLPVVQVEEAIIRDYAQQADWPHRFVTLFILQDLDPLARQLLATQNDHSQSSLPPGGAGALNDLPVVNVYDLADLTSCHVFVNWQVMVKEGYWDDLLAIQGLLAHEHAHPLAVNETTRSSRRIQMELSLKGSLFQTADSDQPSSIPNVRSRVHRLLTLLAEKLSLYAPREIFANEVTIASGFSAALLHLNQGNMRNASLSVAGREGLRHQLKQEVGQGTLTPAAADVLLLIGDLRGYLDLALEVAPFYRTGRKNDARQLDTVLETLVFPQLEPEVSQVYVALSEHYQSLRADLKPPELIVWSEGVLRTLAEALAEKGLEINYRLLQSP
ncbi:MAG: hypothetical protein KJ638_02665 [Chloroflexi bacterium]|nr:hypothetical protein [Chloroflexota bacterium]